MNISTMIEHPQLFDTIKGNSGLRFCISDIQIQFKQTNNWNVLKIDQNAQVDGVNEGSIITRKKKKLDFHTIFYCPTKCIEVFP